jgi:CRP-like cAMP-binding protein
LEDEECSRIEIILSGEVVIENLDEDGNLLTITDFRTGDMLGGNLIFSSNPRYPMTITALSDSVLLLLSKEIILELSKKNSDFLKNYLRLISDNTHILSTKIKTNINKSLKEKIIIFLTHQQNIQDTDMVKLNITKKRLAEKLGVQRTSLSRELKKMQDEGCIDFGRDYIHIKRLK